VVTLHTTTFNTQRFYTLPIQYRIYSRNSRHRLIHAFNTIFKKNYRYNQIYLSKIVSSHKSRNLNLDTKFWLKKCLNYASKYGISMWFVKISETNSDILPVLN